MHRFLGLSSLHLRHRTFDVMDKTGRSGSAATSATLLRQPMQVAAATHHFRWQVHIGWHFNEALWVDLPMEMTSVLEVTLTSGVLGPIIFDTAPGYAYTLGGSPAQTNRETGTTRRMRRVIICTAR